MPPPPPSTSSAHAQPQPGSSMMSIPGLPMPTPIPLPQPQIPAAFAPSTQFSDTCAMLSPARFRVSASTFVPTTRKPVYPEVPSLTVYSGVSTSGGILTRSTTPTKRSTPAEETIEAPPAPPAIPTPASNPMFANYDPSRPSADAKSRMIAAPPNASFYHEHHSSHVNISQPHAQQTPVRGSAQPVTAITYTPNPHTHTHGVNPVGTYALPQTPQHPAPQPPSHNRNQSYPASAVPMQPPSTPVVPSAHGYATSSQSLTSTPHQNIQPRQFTPSVARYATLQGAPSPAPSVPATPYNGASASHVREINGAYPHPTHGAQSSSMFINPHHYAHTGHPQNDDKQSVHGGRTQGSPNPTGYHQQNPPNPTSHPSVANWNNDAHCAIPATITYPIVAPGTPGRLDAGQMPTAQGTQVVLSNPHQNYAAQYSTSSGDYREAYTPVVDNSMFGSVQPHQHYHQPQTSQQNVQQHEMDYGAASPQAVGQGYQQQQTVYPWYDQNMAPPSPGYGGYASYGQQGGLNQGGSPTYSTASPSRDYAQQDVIQMQRFEAPVTTSYQHPGALYSVGYAPPDSPMCR